MAPANDPALRIEDAVNDLCPWSGRPIAAEALTLYNGATVGFCDPAARDKFARAVAAFEDALRARRVANAGLHQ
ncbi:MAG: glutathione S-transferase [Methylorubrum populi]